MTEQIPLHCGFSHLYPKGTGSSARLLVLMGSHQAAASHQSLSCLKQGLRSTQHRVWTLLCYKWGASACIGREGPCMELGLQQEEEKRPWQKRARKGPLLGIP